MIIWCLCILWNDSSQQVNLTITSQSTFNFFLDETSKLQYFLKFQLHVSVLSTIVATFYIRSSHLIVTLKSLIQRVWGGVWDSSFLQSS